MFWGNGGWHHGGGGSEEGRRRGRRNRPTPSRTWPLWTPVTVQVGVVQMGPWVEGTLFVGKLAMHHEAEHSDFFMALTVNLKMIFYT